MNESIEMLHEKVGDLNRHVDKLQRVNGELCAEINRQERRIRELEELVRELAEVLALYAELPDGIAERMGALGLEVDA